MENEGYREFLKGKYVIINKSTQMLVKDFNNELFDPSFFTSEGLAKAYIENNFYHKPNFKVFKFNDLGDC